MKRKAKERLGYAALNMAFVLLCAVTLVPILYAVSVSFSGAGASLSGDFSFIPEPVSYTHLDVYKRQSTGCANTA